MDYLFNKLDRFRDMIKEAHDRKIARERNKFKEKFVDKTPGIPKHTAKIQSFDSFTHAVTQQPSSKKVNRSLFSLKPMDSSTSFDSSE